MYFSNMRKLEWIHVKDYLCRNPLGADGSDPAGKTNPGYRRRYESFSRAGQSPVTERYLTC